MKMVLLGAPGAGKGTLATLMTQKYGIPHISTGDIFRENIREETPLGVMAKSYIDQGALVPDDVTIGLVKSTLAKPENNKGFILDGFPRTLSQAIALNEILDEIKTPLSLALNVLATDDSIVVRLSGRRVCPNCGASFHVEFIKPKIENICDICDHELIQRKDDNPETIKSRLQNYHRENTPLVEYYKNSGTLVELESTHGVDESWEKLQQILKKYIVEE
ncbi:MAG: adenylate kinase [Bacillota bacterium]